MSCYIANELHITETYGCSFTSRIFSLIPWLYSLQYCEVNTKEGLLSA